MRGAWTCSASGSTRSEAAGAIGSGRSISASSSRCSICFHTVPSWTTSCFPLSFAPERRARAAAAGGPESEAQRLLSALGLPPGIVRQAAATLSVGQQQRVAAARALIGSPEIIVADEPTSALDDDGQRDFLDLLFGQIEATGATLIMVSHDQRLTPHFSRVTRLDDLLTTSKRGSDMR